MESRLSADTCPHEGKSNKQQVPYGIPKFLIAFGLDALSPKPTNSSEEIFDYHDDSGREIMKLILSSLFG
jgi:hypothetical protein